MIKDGNIVVGIEDISGICSIVGVEFEQVSLRSSICCSGDSENANQTAKPFPFFSMSNYLLTTELHNTGGRGFPVQLIVA